MSSRCCARRWAGWPRTTATATTSSSRAAAATPTSCGSELGRNGFLGVNIPEEYGGGGAGVGRAGDRLRGARGGGHALVPADRLARRSARELLVAARYRGAEAPVAAARWRRRAQDGVRRSPSPMPAQHAPARDDRDARRRRLPAARAEVLHLGASRGRRGRRRRAHRRPTSATGRGQLSLFLVDPTPPGFETQLIPVEMTAPEKQFTLFFDDVKVPADAPDRDRGRGAAADVLRPQPRADHGRGAGERHRALRPGQGRGLRPGARRLGRPDRRPPGHRPSAGARRRSRSSWRA